MSTRRCATLRDMLSCCLSPPGRTSPSRPSSDNGSCDESFTAIKDIRSRSTETSRSTSTLPGPGVGLLHVATQKLMMTTQHSGVLNHQGNLPLEPQPPPLLLGPPTAAVASAAVDLPIHHGNSSSAAHHNEQPPQPTSCCHMASTCKPSTSADSTDTVVHPAATNMRPAAAAGSDTGSGPAAGSDTSGPDVEARAPLPVASEASTTAASAPCEERRLAPAKLSIIHRYLPSVGGNMAVGTHKISLGGALLQQLSRKGRPGGSSSCSGGGHDAISVRAAISASLAHHIGAAPAAASSFPARSGPARKGPPSPCTPSMALAHLSRARWANLLLPTPPVPCFSAMASATAFPASSSVIMTTSRPSTAADPGSNDALQRRFSDSAVGLADVSLPAGAAAYILRTKGQSQRVEEGSNPLAAAQDFDILGSATSSRSGGGSVISAAAGWCRGLSIDWSRLFMSDTGT